MLKQSNVCHSAQIYIMRKVCYLCTLKYYNIYFILIKVTHCITLAKLNRSTPNS